MVGTCVGRLKGSEVSDMENTERKRMLDGGWRGGRKQKKGRWVGEDQLGVLRNGEKLLSKETL